MLINIILRTLFFGRRGRAFGVKPFRCGSLIFRCSSGRCMHELFQRDVGSGAFSNSVYQHCPSDLDRCAGSPLTRFTLCAATRKGATSSSPPRFMKLRDVTRVDPGALCGGLPGRVKLKLQARLFTQREREREFGFSYIQAIPCFRFARQHERVIRGSCDF